MQYLFLFSLLDHTLYSLPWIDPGLYSCEQYTSVSHYSSDTLAVKFYQAKILVGHDCQKQAPILILIKININ